MISYFVHINLVIMLIGVRVSTPAGEMICKARLLMISADLPARASIVNMKQYNGKYGCLQCEDEGVPRPTTHLVRNWPFSASSTPRTHQSVIFHAKESLRTREPVSVCFLSLGTCSNYYVCYYGNSCRVWGLKEQQCCAHTGHSI